MADAVIIKSSSNGSSLKLSEPKPSGVRYPVEYLRVSLQGREIAASSAQVYLYEPFALATFFANIAATWKGWAGVKQWESIEGDFALACTSDSLGHVTMEVTLKSDIYAEDWRVQVVIQLDAGQLDQIAAEVAKFLRISL